MNETIHTANNADDATGRETKRNLEKCQQCRYARKKCYSEGRVWPQKCNQCLQHRPQSLKCSKPSLNTRKRGPNKRNPNLCTGSDKQQLTGKSSMDEAKPPVNHGPVRHLIVKSPLPPSRLEQPAFPYEFLGEREFRVLVLSPGSKDQKEVRCSFLTASMAQVPEYEAVSYLWAVNNDAQPMMIDIKLEDSQGIVHPIPTEINLYNILRSLRHYTKPRQFWIDALCTNYSNEAESEKDYQATVKRFIFRNAENICFWLGEDANSKTALNFVPKILDLTGIDKLVKDDSAIDGWVAFVALLKNPVFSHLWLVQEITEAQNVTLHCGQPAIHYRDLVDAVTMFVSFRDEISQLFRHCEKSHKELTDRKMRMAERFIDLSINALQVTSSGIQRLLSLEALVSQLIDFSAADPRDRIFSVLAMAKDGLELETDTLTEASLQRPRRDRQLRIEYKRSILDVYQDFVIHATKRSQSLDLICRHWASSVSEKEVSLPTWVRSLDSLPTNFYTNVSERTSADSLVGLPDHNDYNASRGKAADFRFESQPLQFQVPSY